MRLTTTAGIIALLAFVVIACSSKKQEQNEQASEPSGAIVCFFSATGTTAKAAQRIASIAGAELYEITPRDLYTDADLDWRDSTSRSSVEMRDLSSRPALKDTAVDLSKYAVVFIGYPNWWNTHPTLINTFIEANDLQGKTIVPFMTSGGSDIANSEKQLRASYPTLTFAKGLLMNNATDADIRAWVKEAGL